MPGPSWRERMEQSRARAPEERGPSPGRSRYDYASSDPAETARIEEEATSALAERLAREQGLDRQTARERAQAEVARAKQGPEDEGPTTRADAARARTETGQNGPIDVAVRTVGARAIPVVDAGRSTAGEKDEEWRRRMAANLAGLGDVDSAVDIARQALGSPAPALSEEEARAAGVARKWTDDIHNGLAKVWHGLNPTDTLVEKPNTDLITEGVQQTWGGILGYADDPEVRDVVSLHRSTEEERKADGPRGVEGLATRILFKSPVPGLAVDAAEALTTTASDAARVVNLDDLADKIDRLGMSHAMGATLHQIITDTRPSEAFDNLTPVFRELEEQPLRVTAAVSALRPVDIPDRDTAGTIQAEAWRRLLAAHPETRSDPEWATVWRDIDDGADNGRIEWQLSQIPYGTLRALNPSFGPSATEVVALADRRTKALRATGGRSTEALEHIFSSVLLAPTLNEKGEHVYVESRVGQIMRLAGSLAEGVYEADIDPGSFSPTGRGVYAAMAAASDAAGAHTLSRMIREARVPTKAGLDMMAQSGAYDDLLYMAGLDRPRALRIGDPETLRSWAARVATNIQMPEYQGPGYRDFYTRAGGEEHGDIAAGLGLFDLAVDFANPVDDLALHGAGQVVRRGKVAATAASVAPAGTKLSAAGAAAFPELARVTDRDALTAFHEAVRRGVVDAVERGEAPDLAHLDSPELDAVLRQVTSADVRAAVRDVAEKARGRVLASAAEMLDKGTTPEVVVLRQTRAYQRYAAEHAAIMAQNGIPADQIRMSLRWEEALALTMADDPAVTAVRAGHPEDYFGRLKMEAGGTSGPGAYFQGEGKPTAPTFYSSLRRAVEGIKQERLTADQLRATLRNTPGVKADEIEWTGLGRFLAEHPKPTKAEVLGWLDENAVVVEEKRLGAPDVSKMQRMDALAARRKAAVERLVELQHRRPEVAEARRAAQAAQAEADAAGAGMVGVDRYDPVAMRAAVDRNRAAREAREAAESAYDRIANEIHDAKGDDAIRAAVLPEDADEAVRLFHEWNQVRQESYNIGNETRPEPAQYASYQLLGGTNYREVLFRLPMEDAGQKWQLSYTDGQKFGQPFDSESEARASLAQDFGGRADITIVPIGERAERVDYTAPHFGDEGQNLVAHVRMSDRVGPNGEKLLHVEEVQSDWHQAGREKGYSLADTAENRAEYDRLGKAFADASDAADAAPDDAALAQARDAARQAYDDFAERLYPEKRNAGPPPAPFSKTWHELVMKRVLREAAEGGYDGVTWTTGVQQVKRYEDATRQAVDEIRYLRGATPDALVAARSELESARDAYAQAGQEIRRLRTSPDSAAFLDAQGRFDVAARRYDEADRAVQELSDLPAGQVQIVGMKNGREVYRDTMPPEKVADVLGKGMAAKIAESPEASGSLKGADLTIGGEGMKGFYDGILPAWLNKYTKRWGGRVGEGRISTTAAGVVRVEQVPDGWALRDERGAVTGSVYDSPERAQGVADRINAQHMEPVHYLPLTPQMRDALLHEGQPLFQKKGGTVRGSIEPVTRNQRVVGWLMRILNGGDATTMFHEKAHGARFLYGDAWTADLARHFDHVVDPTTGLATLTRKGEEQAAEALRWYQRTKLHPDGQVQALFDHAWTALDRFWFSTRNALSARGLGSKPDAPLLPAELATFWDAQFNPGGRARRSVPIEDREALRPVQVVKVSDDPAKAVVADEPARVGKRREFARVDTAPAHVRQALGIDDTVTEMDPVELWSRALAYTATEKFRSRGWGTEPYVRVGTARTVVPESRVPRVLAAVSDKVITALGAKAPTIQNGMLDLTVQQRAGVQGLVNEAKRSAFGPTLPEAVRDFDHLNPASQLGADDWSTLVATLTDIHAGVASRRNLRAETMVSAPMISAALSTVREMITDRESVRHVQSFMQKLVGVDTLEKYMGPQVRGAVEEVRRELGHSQAEFEAMLKAARRGGARAPVDYFRRVLGSMNPMVHPLDVPALREWRERFTAQIGSAGKRANAAPDITLDHLLTPPAGQPPPIDGLEAALARAPHLGASGITEAEAAALAMLRTHEGQRLAAGVDWPTVLADPQAYDQITDALGVLQVGVERRWTAYEREAREIAQALAGSNEAAIVAGIPAAILDGIYDDFWSGNWLGITPEEAAIRGVQPSPGLYGTASNLGFTVAGPSYNQAQAMAAMMLRLRGNRILASLGDKLLDLGIAADTERATTLGTRIGATYGDEIGMHGAFGYDRLRARVRHWLNNIVLYRERPVEAGHIDPATGKWTVSYTQENPGVDLRDPAELEAYTLAHRYLAQLGWQYGEGSFGDTVVTLPDGREMFMPQMLWQYLSETLDSTAKTGGAYAGAQKGGGILGNAWRNVSGAVAQNIRTGMKDLGLSNVDSELGRLTPLTEQEVAVKGRREVAQATGATAGSLIGYALLGWPGGILGAPLGRNVLPMAIEAGGELAQQGRRQAGALGGAVGLVGGTIAGASLGAVKTAVDGLRVLYPMTFGMARVGLTSGLIVPHAAFYVANTFGAAFQTYLRTGIGGLASTAKQFAPYFGEPAMIGKMLADMAGWNRVADTIPEPRPFITRTGEVWTLDRLTEAAKSSGLDSSFVKSVSTNQLADAMRGMMGTAYDRLIAHPFDATIGGQGLAGAVQDAIVELASAVDNANRVGVFIDQLKRGIGPDEAATIARHAAFDYGNLSEFERAVFRPIVMFYSYLRQSVGLFWWTLLHHPSRVLGTLRASRGARYQNVEDPELTLGEGMDARMLLFWKDAEEQGHANQGVATVSPPMPVDAISLFAELLGALGGNRQDQRRVVGHLSPQAQFFAVVMPTGTDLFTGADVDDYNVVPNWLVSLDRDATGGILSDALQLEVVPQRDPSKADYPGAPRYQAKNGRAWWVFRNLIQVPPFGRYLDEMSTLDRWAPMGDPGPVSTLVQQARQYRERGGDPDLDAFLRDYVRPAFGVPPGKRGLLTPQVDDLYPPREDVSNAQEGAGLLGFKSYVVPRPELKADAEVADANRRLRDIAREAESSRP